MLRWFYNNKFLKANYNPFILYFSDQILLIRRKDFLHLKNLENSPINLNNLTLSARIPINSKVLKQFPEDWGINDKYQYNVYFPFLNPAIDR
jgi:hypothetical protein